MFNGIYLRLATQSIKKNHRISIPFICGSAFITALYLSIANICVLPSLNDTTRFSGQQLLLVMSMGIVVIRIFMFILFFYLNSVWLKNKKQENGVFTILGMDRKHLIQIQLDQMIICYLLSMVIGIPLGILMSFATVQILEWMVPSLIIDFAIMPSAIRDSALWIGACYLAISLYSIVTLIRTNPLEQVKKTGEKKIRSNWVLALLGFLSLGAGYWIAITIEDPVTAVMLFFVAVTLVIIGTYLLFLYGSTVILNALQKNRRYFYKTNHFINVSTMKYRLKQNAASLASIAILSTMVLVTLSSTSALFAGARTAVDQAYKAQHTLNVQVSDDSAIQIDQLLPTIQNVAQQVGMDTSSMQVNSSKSYYLDSGMQVTLYDISNAEEFGLDPINLEANQAVVLQFIALQGQEETIESFDVEDRHFEIVEHVDKPSANPMPHIDAIIDFSKNGIVPTYSTIQMNGDLEGVMDEEREQEIANSFGQALQAQFPDESMYVNYVNKNMMTERLLGMYSAMLFVGIYLSLLFLVSVILIMYYKQISEGYEDHDRFAILQKVGLEKKQIRKVINDQVIAVFFLPLLVAIVHLCFAFPLIKQILYAMSLPYAWVFILACAVTILIFAICYFVVYKLSARVYYQIATQQA